MYTRNFGKQKYMPPPGYDGTAFGTAVGTKHHEPMEIIRTENREPEVLILPEPDQEIYESEDPAEDAVDEETHSELQPVPVHRDENENPLRQLLDSIRGKFGTEELIILLVMLLIASDGFGAEMLVLGILLAVGN